MATFLDEVRKVLIHHGIKTVTKTDAAKGAYVVSNDQYQSLRLAGYSPGLHKTAPVVPLIDLRTGGVYPSSYYNSQRGSADRAPETRMGRGVMQLISEGDELLIGTDGRNVFALVIAGPDVMEMSLGDAMKAVEPVYRKLDPKRLLDRAIRAKGKPAATESVRTDYVRDAAVKEYVLRRCAGVCEVPGCGYRGFPKDDGTLYIEVHHVEPLGDGGDDTIENTAGICPNCHAKAHHGRDRTAFKATLQQVVAEANHRYQEALG